MNLDSRNVPYVISSFDLPDAGRLMVHNCEDCACAVSDDRHILGWIPVTSKNSLDMYTKFIYNRQIIEIPIDNEWKVLFNPLGNNGAVVVNLIVLELLHQLKHGSTFEEIFKDSNVGLKKWADTFQRLISLQVIQPAGILDRSPNFNNNQMLTAWLHITNACNLDCPYCYLNKTSEGMDEATGCATIEAIVNSALNNGFQSIKLKYAGGESTLNYPLILKLHDHAKTLMAEHDIQLHGVILSNGVSFSTKLINELKKRNIRIMISLDGIGYNHDSQRSLINGKPSFRLVDNTISKLIQSEYHPHISITVTQRNLNGLPEVVQYALERNLTFSLNFFRENDCAVHVHDLKYQENEMIDALLHTFEVIETHLPRWSILGAVLDRGQLIQSRKRPCGVGQDYIVIDQQGKVAKCHMEIEKTIGDVFRSDPLLLVRQDTKGVQNPSVDEKEGCKDCTWRYWCSGGCPVATFNATGRFDIKSPNCNIYKAIYPTALRLEGLRLLKFSGYQ
ncbi:MAG: SPASM domain-containing protein [Anaerolineae bacterium]|nr:SPASM domain-containing protein [Anaerolineae bacterium]